MIKKSLKIKKTVKYWKEYAYCQRCGQKFEVVHKLRLYCDKCKKKIQGEKNYKK